MTFDVWNGVAEVMGRTVVVTALNMITALGLDLDASWRGLIDGRSGVQTIASFDTSELVTRVGAPLPAGFDDYSKSYVNRRQARQMARATVMGLVCTKAAVERSGIDWSKADRDRCGVIFGAADTGHSAIYDQEFWILKTMLHSVPALVSQEYELQGPSLAVSAACASSAYAIGMAHDLIASGQADVVIAGGASSILNPEHIRGFNEVRALSTENAHPAKACRPFSLDRDGFVIGEGAAVLVLEALDTALARQATIYGEIAGYAMRNEAYNLMSPRAKGAGMAQAMQSALRHAQVSADEIDYVNAHGTGTVQNDKFETEAIKQVFGERALQLPVSSAKAMIGHTAAACGAVEAVITLRCLAESLIVPTINYTRDPELDLDYVPDVARPQPLNVALSNSFGFGGCNASLVLRRWTNQAVGSPA